jgi:CheY-like chemotaxis protein
MCCPRGRQPEHWPKIDATPSLDAVVTEIAMPDVNGVELVRKIRQHSARKSIR